MAAAASEFHYDVLHQKFKNGIPCPDDFSFPSHVLSHWARVQPAQPALHWVSHDFATERVVSYAELDDLTHRAAKAFHDAGLKKGDRSVTPSCPRRTPGGSSRSSFLIFFLSPSPPPTPTHHRFLSQSEC